MDTDIINAITPAVFLGRDRRIAYEGRKYHSGWICTGVCIEFAGTLLIESPKIYGKKKEIIIDKNNIIMINIRSLIVKYGWKWILSIFLFSPILFLDPS